MSNRFLLKDLFECMYSSCIHINNVTYVLNDNITCLNDYHRNTYFLTKSLHLLGCICGDMLADTICSTLLPSVLRLTISSIRCLFKIHD